MLCRNSHYSVALKSLLIVDMPLSHTLVGVMQSAWKCWIGSLREGALCVEWVQHEQQQQELLAVSYHYVSILGCDTITCWSPQLVSSLYLSSPWLSQNYCKQSGDFCDIDCCFLGSKKMQLNSFQVTTTLAFVFEVLSSKNIRCLKEENLSQESQRSEPELINQRIMWLSLLHIQHMYFCLLLTVAWIIHIAEDQNTAIFLTVSMKLISCRCWLEAGSILHFQA